MVWNKAKELDKAVWLNQVVLFLQPFCFMTEQIMFQASNFKLCRSRRYCSYLTRFWSIFSFMHPENIKILWFSYISKRYKKVTLTSIGLILIVCRNYNVLQSFYFGNYWLGKETYISKIWNFKFRIFNSKLIFPILWFHSLGTSWWSEKCTHLFLWKIRFVYIFVRLTLISHAF